MNAQTKLPFGTEQALSRFAHLWCEAATSSDASSSATLLRLHILRDLFRTLHAEKSRYLATGMKSEARALKPWEEKLEELRKADLRTAEDDIYAALNNPTTLKKRSRVLPQGLFQVIDREKLERYDRTWENALAAEACSVGWRVWRLEASVIVSQLEAWNIRLSELLWPDGVVLFVESAGFEEHPSADSQSARWRGHWIIALNPRFRAANEISIDFTVFPGATGSAPLWKPLYTPSPPPQKIAVPSRPRSPR